MFVKENNDLKKKSYNAVFLVICQIHLEKYLTDFDESYIFPKLK